MVIQTKSGILVFIDDSLRKVRNTSSDVFTDSLLPDFFIPIKFSTKSISESAIKKAFFEKKNLKISFVNISRDCNSTTRKSSMLESLRLELDKEIDEYVGSKRLFLLPVQIDYLYGKSNFDYLSVRKSLTLQKGNDSVRLEFKNGYLDIGVISVLEYEWPSIYK
jgi:hypothetical protein